MHDTLLIADDSEHKKILMKGMLNRAGWTGEILEAVTTSDAKQLIDEREIGFALIDFYIPSENGPALIGYLKEKNPDAHIALVSSSDTYENTEAARGAGAETCICTSYPADEVEQKFMELLEEWNNPGDRV